MWGGETEGDESAGDLASTPPSVVNVPLAGVARTRQLWRMEWEEGWRA